MSEEMAKEKANFLRILVHELKSPVSATKMMADLLSCYPAENPKVRGYSEKNLRPHGPTFGSDSRNIRTRQTQIGRAFGRNQGVESGRKKP